MKEQGKSIDDLISNLKCPKESDELRFNIKCDDFKEYGEKVISDFEEFFKNRDGWHIADDNREGIRVSNNGGWVLLRMSVHDPIMPMNVESDREGGVAEILKTVKPFFEKREMLDISPFDVRNI